jgi:hypothetical protein
VDYSGVGDSSSACKGGCGPSNKFARNSNGMYMYMRRADLGVSSSTTFVIGLIYEIEKYGCV